MRVKRVESGKLMRIHSRVPITQTARFLPSADSSRSRITLLTRGGEVVEDHSLYDMLRTPSGLVQL
jgi:hypothetical protein